MLELAAALDEDEQDWRVAQWVFGIADDGARADSNDEATGLHCLESLVTSRLQWIREQECGVDGRETEGRTGPRSVRMNSKRLAGGQVSA